MKHNLPGLIVFQHRTIKNIRVHQRKTTITVESKLYSRALSHEKRSKSNQLTEAKSMNENGSNAYDIDVKS